MSSHRLRMLALTWAFLHAACNNTGSPPQGTLEVTSPVNSNASTVSEPEVASPQQSAPESHAGRTVVTSNTEFKPLKKERPRPVNPLFNAPGIEVALFKKDAGLPSAELGAFFNSLAVEEAIARKVQGLPGVERLEYDAFCESPQVISMVADKQKGVFPGALDGAAMGIADGKPDWRRTGKDNGLDPR